MWLKMDPSKFLKIAFMASILLAPQLQAQESKITVEQDIVPKVSLKQDEMISFFIKEFFIPETLVTRIDIIDATGNGFGEKDLAITYPSGEIYFIFPSQSAQKIMNTWKFTPNFQIVGENLDPDIYAELPTDRAANNIFSTLIKGVERNYREDHLKIRFERTGTSTIFEMWGYDPKMLKYTPPPLGDGKDFMYIYTSVKDTILVEK